MPRRSWQTRTKCSTKPFCPHYSCHQIKCVSWFSWDQKELLSDWSSYRMVECSCFLLSPSRIFLLGLVGFSTLLKEERDTTLSKQSKLLQNHGFPSCVLALKLYYFNSNDYGITCSAYHRKAKYLEYSLASFTSFAYLFVYVKTYLVLGYTVTAALCYTECYKSNLPGCCLC